MVEQGLAAAVTAVLAALSVENAAGAAGQDTCGDRRRTRSVTTQASQARPAADLGLSARLDRTSAVYAVRDRLALEITTTAPAMIEVWNINAAGARARLAPLDPARPLIVRPGRALRLPEALGATYTVATPAGPSEIVVVAHAARGARSAEFDPDLVGRARRQDVILCYTVVE